MVDMTISMSSIRRYVRIFWALAILLMAGGQLAQSQERAECAEKHSYSQKAEKSKCPIDDHGCSITSAFAVVLDQAAGLPSVPFRAHVHHGFDESYTEGSRAEIDYPPQLS